MWVISDPGAAGAPSAQSQQCPVHSAAEQTSGGILQTLLAFLCGGGCTFVVAATVVYLVWRKLEHDKTRYV